MALGPSARERQDEELIFLHRATRASDELLVTWARHDGLSSALDLRLLRELTSRDEKEEALQELGEVEAESLPLTRCDRGRVVGALARRGSHGRTRRVGAGVGRARNAWNCRRG